MYPQLLISSIFINFVVANDQISMKYGEQQKPPNAVENKNNLVKGFPKWRQHFWKPRKNVHHNATYIDKAENMIRLPIMSKFDDKKKKLMKKSPKRTIQKIIKKNRQKTKKIYVIKMTSPTVSPDDFEVGQDELAQWKDDSTTVPTNQKKKSRKYNYSKIARYPMPFQRMQKMKNHRRDKRHTFSREDFYILKDFNELKFLHDDKDFSVVKAHIKKYW